VAADDAGVEPFRCPVDVGFKVNVHCVSVSAVKALINIILWIITVVFITCLVVYIGAAGTLPDSSKKDLEIVMLVSVIVFAATWYTKRKQLPVEGADDEPPQAD